MSWDDLLFGLKILPGQELTIAGGYEYKKEWGEEEKAARAIKFIPGQGKKKALLVQFKHTSPFIGFEAQFAVLEMVEEDREWRDGVICSVEVFEQMPEDKEWKDRAHGPVVESKAQVTVTKK